VGGPIFTVTANVHGSQTGRGYALVLESSIGFDRDWQVYHSVCNAIGANDESLARDQIKITVWRQIVASAGLSRCQAATCRKGAPKES